MGDHTRASVDSLAREPESDELRRVVSLFADVVGSTGLGERLSPAEVKALIGECVSRMCEAIEMYGGSVRSYMGDGIAGFFGIDVAREDDDERAARAALEIQRVVRQYAEEVRSAWGVPDFNVRVGINSGRVAVGRIGSADPQRLALGDSINVAARLQSAARPGTVVIGSSVAETIGERFVVQPLGPIAVKGRGERVEAFELRAEDFAYEKQWAEGPFIGRANELSVLVSSLADLNDGRGQVVVIRGEAGVGKSRLVREIRRRSASDLVWLESSCDSNDERLPYRPFVDALCAWLGVTRQASAIEIRVRLNTVGRSLLGSEFEDVAPLLGRVLGISLTRRLDQRMDGIPPSDLEGALVRALGVWIRALAREAPVVFAVDNLCAAGEATVAATESLLAVVEDCPLLLMFTARSEVRGPWENLRSRALIELRSRVIELELHPLTEAESRALVSALDARKLLSAKVADVVVERAEGNALYIEELVAAVSGGLADVRYPNNVPSALEAALLARIDALPASARRALQYSAVLGRTFMHDVVLGMAIESDIEAGIAELVRSDVIRERGRDPRMYGFRHGLIRDAALSTLTPARFKQLSMRAAESLRAWERFDPDRDACALVGFYVDADRSEAAVDSVDRLASQLIRMCRWDAAADLLMECLERIQQTDRDELYVTVAGKLATVLEEQGRSEEAVSWLNAALEKGTRSHVRSSLRTARARCLADIGRFEEAERQLRAYLNQATDAIDVAEAQIALGSLALEQGNVATAAECVAAIGGEIAALPPQVAFRAASLTAGVSATRGALNEAELWSLRALVIADQLGQVSLQLKARGHVALVCMLKGGYAEANARMSAVYEESDKRGLLAIRMQTAVSLMHLKIHCGELELAARIGEASLKEPAGQGVEGMVLANLACVRAEQGQYAEARRLSESVLSRNRDGVSWVVCAAREALAQAAAASEDAAAEDRELSLALGVAQSQRDFRTHQHLCLSKAERALRLGDTDQCEDWLKRANVSLNDTDCVGLVRFRRIAMRVKAAADPADAITTLSMLRAEAGRMGLRLEEARIAIALGVIDATRRDDYFAEAARLFELCGSGQGLRELAKERTRTLTALRT